MKGCERMHLKNIINFLGLWSYPFGLSLSGLLLYFIQTMRMQEFTLNRENITGIAIGGLIAPFFVVLSNFYDYLSKGKKDFTPNLAFKKDVTMISDSKRQAMYKKVEKSDNLLKNKPEGLILGKQG